MGHAGQKKNHGAAVNGLRCPKEKIAARQSGYRAGQKKNCGVEINGLRQPKEKITARQSMDCTGQKKKLQRSNWDIAPASSKKLAVRQSRYCTCLFKICGAAIRVSCLPLQKLHKAWVSHRMVGARLESHAKWLARGLRIAPNSWCEAEYRAKWWREANIALNGVARFISRLMVARG